jgi:hypothetical protein
MTYDTRAEGGKTGDVSRFIHQLKYQYSDRVKSFVEKNVNYSVKLSKDEHIEVKKNDIILGKLEEFYKGRGPRKLSASSLNDYIDCPLRFYFAHVEKIDSEDEVLEDLDASVFGTIFHEVMQKLYEGKIGTLITKEILEEMRADTNTIEDIVLKSFARNYYKSKTVVPLTGRLSLRGEVIKRMVDRTLELDEARAPFVMLQTELKIETSVKLPSGIEVQIKGIIDRLDLKGEKINIIDYKSGEVTIDFENIDSLFVSGKSRGKQVFQVLFYVYLLKNAIKDEITKKVVNEKVSSLMASAGINGEDHSKSFAPGLYSFVNYFADYFKWQIRKKAGNSYVTFEVEPMSDVYREYVDKLEMCIAEMFDKDQLFKQAQDKEVCKFCSFVDLCRR